MDWVPILVLITCMIVTFATGLIVGEQYGEKVGRLLERFNGPDDKDQNEADI